MSDNKQVFASPLWLDFVARQLQELAAEYPDFRYSNCSVYTDVPRSIRGESSSRVAYSFSIMGGEAEMSLQEVDANEVDVKVIANWSKILPLATMHYDLSSPECILHVQSMNERLVHQGYLVNQTSRDVSDEEVVIAAELHNRIAAGTSGE